MLERIRNKFKTFLLEDKKFKIFLLIFFRKMKINEERGQPIPLNFRNNNN